MCACARYSLGCGLGRDWSLIGQESCCSLIGQEPSLCSPLICWPQEEAAVLPQDWAIFPAAPSPLVKRTFTWSVTPHCSYRAAEIHCSTAYKADSFSTVNYVALNTSCKCLPGIYTFLPHRIRDSLLCAEYFSFTSFDNRLLL